ncbi:MAG: Ig-like domain-containing protein, partial [Proteobacteria bacterium]|nr:Ig-like domain-containing protein [Pseudomonadota bacterium]
MRHLLIILSLLLLSFTIISCGSDDGGSSSSDNTTSTTTSSDETTTPDTTPPKVSSSSPSDGDSSISFTSNVSVTFSESMDTSSVTTNTLDTSCFGTFQVSSDGFTTCIQMSSSPTSSNSDKTFTVTPKNDLLHSTVYRIRITTGTKDSSGNSLSSEWTTSSGFQSSKSSFFSVGQSGTILTSSDNGITWTERTSGTSGNLNDITYGNGVFVSVGYGNILTSSDNGTSWTSRTSVT